MVLRLSSLLMMVESRNGDNDWNSADAFVVCSLLQDQLGIIARISKVIASRGANILNVYLYIDFDGGKQSPVFYARR
jgi:formyltetrahydrofolate hydrolase